MIRKQLDLDGVLELVIDRPPVNAYSIGLLNELADLFDSAGQTPNVHVILLRAEGRGFCGGGDLKEVESLPSFEGILGQSHGAMRVSLSALTCAVPVVSAIHNYCVGVGVLLAGSTDIIVASAGARFVLAEVDNGATAGGAYALRLMPEKLVRAAMMTAEPIFAEQLHGYGSVYKVVPQDQVAAVAMAVAAKIAGKNPAATRQLKLSLNGSAKSRELQDLFRTELSYTYELNMKGVSAEQRRRFIDGARKGYL